MCLNCWRIAWTVIVGMLIGDASAQPPLSTSNGTAMAMPKDTSTKEGARKGLVEHSRAIDGTFLMLVDPPWQIHCNDLASDALRIVRFDGQAQEHIQRDGRKVVIREKTGTEVPVVLEYRGGEVVSAMFLAQAGKEYEIALAQTSIRPDNRNLIARREAGESPQEVTFGFYLDLTPGQPPPPPPPHPGGAWYIVAALVAAIFFVKKWFSKRFAAGTPPPAAQYQASDEAAAQHWLNELQPAADRPAADPPATAETDSTLPVSESKDSS